MLKVHLLVLAAVSDGSLDCSTRLLHVRKHMGVCDHCCAQIIRLQAFYLSSDDRQNKVTHLVALLQNAAAAAKYHLAGRVALACLRTTQAHQLTQDPIAQAQARSTLEHAYLAQNEASIE